MQLKRLSLWVRLDTVSDVAQDMALVVLGRQLSKKARYRLAQLVFSKLERKLSEARYRRSGVRRLGVRGRPREALGEMASMLGVSTVTVQRWLKRVRGYNAPGDANTRRLLDLAWELSAEETADLIIGDLIEYICGAVSWIRRGLPKTKRVNAGGG